MCAARPAPSRGGCWPSTTSSTLREVRDPQRSPDGKWVAYTVTRAIRDTDKNDTDVWMVSWDGTQQIQVTSTPESESRPRWSPDGTLSCRSSRPGRAAKEPQLWLLNRSGGEASKLTDVKGRRLRLRLVARQRAPRPGRRRPRSVRSPRGDRRRQGQGAEDAQADRRRSLPLQVRRRRLSARPALAPLPVRHRGEEDRAADARRLRRGGRRRGRPTAGSIAFIRRHGEGDVDKAPNKRSLRRRRQGRRARRGG